MAAIRLKEKLGIPVPVVRHTLTTLRCVLHKILSLKLTTEFWPSDAWWRHQMETFYAVLALCAGNSPVTGVFPAQRPLTRSFDVFFNMRLNKRLSKQSWGWWFETPSGSLWCHCNDHLTSWLSVDIGLLTNQCQAMIWSYVNSLSISALCASLSKTTNTTNDFNHILVLKYKKVITRCLFLEICLHPLGWFN